MDSNYLSSEQLEKAIVELSDIDILRLTMIARKYVGGHEMEAQELINEAVLRTLDGSRNSCPSDVSIITFLSNVIRSIASNARKKTNNAENLLLSIDENEPSDSRNTPDENAIEKEQYSDLERIFEGDDEILLVIFYLQEGFSASEIQNNEGWSKTNYNSIRKRMRRKLNSHIKQETRS